jgi:hypothetical protein
MTSTRHDLHDIMKPSPPLLFDGYRVHRTVLLGRLAAARVLAGFLVYYLRLAGDFAEMEHCRADLLAPAAQVLALDFKLIN